MYILEKRMIFSNSLIGVQISSTFYAKQIPKAQKNIDNLTAFFSLLGSAHVKAARRMLMKLTLGFGLFVYFFIFYYINAHECGLCGKQLQFYFKI